MTTPAHAPDATVNLPELPTFFGEAYPAMSQFHDRLRAEGGVRGLVGPRELDRLWERHILNSAAIVPFLPSSGTVADVGSGAGFPGIVVAAMRPDMRVLLIEPMDRRCQWLVEIAGDLGLVNVDVMRGRAEEFHGAFECEAVTSRAVASLEKLARISLPLVRVTGQMVILKGRRVIDELEPARGVLRRLGAGDVEILEAPTISGVENTTVVRIVRQTGARRK